jgi:hypothetical protein
MKFWERPFEIYFEIFELYSMANRRYKFIMIAVPRGVEVWPHISTMQLGVSSQLHNSSPAILAQEKSVWFMLDVKLVLMLWKRDISVPVLGN